MMKFAAIELCIGHNMWFDKNAPWNMGEHYNKFRDFYILTAPFGTESPKNCRYWA